MSNYACIFAGGFYGTFLVYFINQHEGFSKGEFVANHKHWSDEKLSEDNPVHLNMPKHSYYYKPHMTHVEKFKGQVELMEWDKFRAQHDCEKLAFKPVPHHYDMFDDEYCNHLQEKAWLIVCNFEKSKEHAIKRVRKYGLYDDDTAENYVRDQNENALALARRRGAYLLDMSSLMNCDIRTYGTLCQYLKTKPLDGWQTLVNDHKERIGYNEFE